MGELFYWITGPWPGRLAIVPRPRGGDWLEDDIRFWKRSGVDVVVSLLTHDEIEELVLEQEESLCRLMGVEPLSLPLPDRGVPSSPREMLDLVTALDASLKAGKTVAIHCRQGIGRAGLTAGCLLAFSGVSVESAFRHLSEVRGVPVPETAEQREWAQAFTARLSAVHTPTV